MSRRVVFGVIVGDIGGSGAPIDQELALSGPVLDPVEAHVDRLRSFLLDGAVGETDSSGVVNLYGRRWLGVAHFGKSGSDRDSGLGIEIGCANLGFSRRAHDVAKDFAEGVNGFIGVWSASWGFAGVTRLVAQYEVATGTAASTVDGEVRRV